MAQRFIQLTAISADFQDLTGSIHWSLIAEPPKNIPSFFMSARMYRVLQPDGKLGILDFVVRKEK
jgi:hypothetical protein